MDAKGISNQGLGLLGSYSVNSIAPAVTPLEKRIAGNYNQWKTSELTKRRWVFNNYTKTLTVSGSAPHATVERPNAFDLPNDCLAPIRKKTDTWIQRGKKLYTWDTVLYIEYKADVAEELFDVLFNDVLAFRIAFENVEWVTQSNVKKADVGSMYKDAIRTAAANNSLIIGAEDDANEDDSKDSWLAARYGVGI